MREQAEQWLKQLLGEQAYFRDGQWEAIEALVVKHQRALVVQRTGWGKSLVYFMATRLLRQQGAGITILISPLLSLIRNQEQSAAQWGINARSIHSENSEDHRVIQNAVLLGKLDLLLISPERLANANFQENVWSTIRHKIGLLVIDEAHCISDWGHDFRPNYRRLMKVLDDIPAQTPVLGTTATANDRVVADVAEILGAQMNIQRGALTRESLSLYVYPESMDAALRLTLLSHLMKHIPGSGIIYCTTTRDCQVVAEWLQLEGFNVKPYFADVENMGGENRVDLERQLMQNQVKALVSSVALGMGFDKSDLHFVIHYQLPGNIINYYQQIGRAGRGIANAHIVLMYGDEDEEIQHYFIDSAFPPAEKVLEVIEILHQHGEMTKADLQRYVNVRQGTLEKIVTHLEVEGIISSQRSTYTLIDPDRQPDYVRWQAVTQTRYHELEQMKSYIKEEGCLMQFIARALDDPRAVQPCGRCKNCTGAQSKFQPAREVVLRAQAFLRQGKPLTFEPRKQLPAGLPGGGSRKVAHLNEIGIALATYYDSGWGEMVRAGRANSHYDDELVAAAAELLTGYWAELSRPPQVVIPIPSQRRPTLVPDFARRLANALRLPYQEALRHVRSHAPQVEMKNSYQQASNVLRAFDVQEKLSSKPVLLVDDYTDSRWTLTMVGQLLQRDGSGKVYPFVLGIMNPGAGRD